MQICKSRFSLLGILLTTTEPKRFTVSIGLPGNLSQLESNLTGKQLFSFNEFQKAVLIDHGVMLYNDEIDKARGTNKRSQIWRSILLSHSPELV